MFDVFISHNNEDKRWVVALANNLKRSGFSVWLDLLESSRDRAVGGREILGTARRGLLLATPHSLETAWLQEQIEAMRARQQEEPQFQFVPLYFGASVKARWLNSPLSVDFSRPGPMGYRAAFHNLLSVLRKQPSDSSIAMPSDLEIPKPHIPRLHDMASRPLAKGEQHFLGQVFEILEDNRPVMLLSQPDQDRLPIQRAILAEAQRRYKVGNIIHLVPPGHVEASKAEYFGYLCDQIAREKNLSKASDFENLMESLIARGNTLFLLMTRIEEGSAEGRRALSHSLRNLNERYFDWLKVVLCGGENLLELRYKESNLSPLRKAEPVVLPEHTAEDILQWLGNDAGGMTAGDAATLLSLTGGNERLIRLGLRARTQSGPLNVKALVGQFWQDAILRTRFADYRESGDAGRVASLLSREDLGHYDIWPIQALLRHLYWDGLLAERQGRLRWRSELIRQIGRDVMGG